MDGNTGPTHDAGAGQLARPRREEGPEPEQEGACFCRFLLGLWVRTHYLFRGVGGLQLKAIDQLKEKAKHGERLEAMQLKKMGGEAEIRKSLRGWVLRPLEPCISGLRVSLRARCRGFCPVPVVVI